MNNITVSVIIPVYNTEKYLEECLKSVINQTLKEIEIICIDDGSTDNSPDILKEYSEKDGRIRIYSQTNKGQGAARNRGIDLAKGEYVYFIDSDDFMEINALEKAYDCCKQYDLDFVMFQIINYIDESKEYYEDYTYNIASLLEHEKFKGVFNYKDCGEKIFEITVQPCNKLYKREFLLNHNIRFPEGLIFEDNVFFFNIMLSAQRTYVIKKHLYIRRRRKGSTIQCHDEKHFDIIPITNQVIDVFKEHNLFEEFEERLCNYKISSTFVWFDAIWEEYRNEFFIRIKTAFKQIQEDKESYEKYLDNLNIKNKIFFENIIKSSNLEEFELHNIKVSVIVPAYNTGKYLPKCLDSIINQTLKEIEIICINDGSRDDSLEIFNEYAGRDRRIKVFSHENKGLGASRNVGMNLAKGEYLYFIDSDDFIDLNALEETYYLAKENDLDLVCFQGMNYDDEKETFYEDGYLGMNQLADGIVFNYKDIQDIMFDLSVNVGNKLFKREFLEDIDARFSENLIFEDTPLYYKVMLSAKKIFFVKKPYYKRRRRADSITMSNDEKFFDMIPITDEVFSVFKNRDLFESFEKELYDYKIKNIFIWFDRIDSEYKNEFYNKIKEHFESIEDDDYLSFRNKTRFRNIKNSNTLEEFYLLMEIAKLKEELKNKDLEIGKYKKKNKKLKNEVKKLRKLNNSILNSNSWKLTSCFRKIVNILRR